MVGLQFPTKAGAQEEKARIIGRVLDERTVDVNGLLLTVSFKGRTAEVKAVVGKDVCMYGELLYDKGAFSLAVSSIDEPSRSSRIEAYNGHYPVVRVADGYCIVESAIGRFKFFFRNMERAVLDSLRQGLPDVPSMVFYFDDDEKEICVRLPKVRELEERAAVRVDGPHLKQMFPRRVGFNVSLYLED